ncbi:MAG: LytTR family DNA-binding domain-containing protein [Bacteroidetes bacterium]|nr:LytTR family DNA-binding domain-containing protein [Bacteroidota bacterium]
MSKAISLIYVDDSEIDTIKFETVISNFKEVEVLGTFINADEAFEFCCINKPDLALIDIVIPGGNNGIWLAQKLKEINVPFGFISSYDNYAYEAFKINALHYLPRPVTALAIRELLDRYNAYMDDNDTDTSPLSPDTLGPGGYPKRIYVNTQKQILIIQLDDVTYVEAEGSYTNFHMADGKVIVSGKNLKKYSDQIEMNPDFIRIHRSYIINQSHLESINKRKMEMTFMFKNKIEIRLATFRRGEWMNKFI